MERLRAAIEQARKTRSAGTQARGSDEAAAAKTPRADTIAGPVSGGAPNDIVARWERLAELKLKPQHLKRNRLVWDESDAERGPYDMLRTRLLSVVEKEGWRRVAITSPTPECGKTTTALNLAMSLSRQSDMPAIVFEADMRRPAMAEMLGVSGGDSFFDVLQGRAEFADQAVRIGETVALSLNHGVASDPAELLHRRRTGAVLDLIQEAYEPGLMIFDLPPMLNNDDTLAVIPHVDCAILIARSETTTLEQIDQCESELAAHTNVAGVVLNRCRYGVKGYGYGYGKY